MTIARLLLIAACIAVAWVEAVLAALLWPIGDAMPPIDALDAWLAGFVTVGVAALLFSMHRQIAAPLIATCDSLLLAARGLPSPPAVRSFGRGDEVGELALVLATLQAESAQRTRLQAELQALQDELSRRLDEAAGLSRLADDILDAIPVPISVCDLQGRIAFVNRAWEHCFGVARDAVMGLHAGDDGTERQRVVRLQGALFHRSHAVIDDTEGDPAAVVTTFRPASEDEAFDPAVDEALEAILRSARHLLGGRLTGTARAHVESIAASASGARAVATA